MPFHKDYDSDLELAICHPFPWPAWPPLRLARNIRFEDMNGDLCMVLPGVRDL